MVLNKQTFITRAVTAIIFAAVMLIGLFWSRWSFFILFSIIHFGCWWEYLKLVEKITGTVLHLYTKLGLMLTGYGFMLLFCNEVYAINGFAVRESLSMPLSTAGFIFLLLGIFQNQVLHAKAFFMALLGVVYISLSWGLMLDLSATNDIKLSDAHYTIKFWLLPSLVVFSIWINDTMAYIVGSMIGKTPLSKISPKKTWEGTAGGLMLSVLILGLTAYFILDNKGLILYVVIIAAIASIAGTFGDLLESKLKRMAGVKDSGSIMPGHGGFLDRFDSLLLAVPFVWLYVNVLL